MDSESCWPNQLLVINQALTMLSSTSLLTKMYEKCSMTGLSQKNKLSDNCPSGVFMSRNASICLFTLNEVRLCWDNITFGIIHEYRSLHIQITIYVGFVKRMWFKFTYLYCMKSNLCCPCTLSYWVCTNRIGMPIDICFICIAFDLTNSIISWFLIFWMVRSIWRLSKNVTSMCN